MEPSEFHRRAPLKDKQLSTAKLYSYGGLQVSKQPDVHVDGLVGGPELNPRGRRDNVQTR